MTETIEFTSGSTELLDRISPLWEKIKAHHVRKSLHFSEEMNSKSFTARKKDLILKAKYLRVDIAIDSITKKDVGYCISTIDSNNRGEIDSLFIEEPFRKQGIGKKLTEMALTWLKSNNATDSSIFVAFGNEEVLDFYKSFGFYPRGIYLAQKP